MLPSNFSSISILMQSSHRDVNSRLSPPVKKRDWSDWFGDMPEDSNHNSDQSFEPDGDDYETTEDEDKMTMSDIFKNESSESDPGESFSVLLSINNFMSYFT